ncbi:MAG: DUF2971 domain-containing protein [Rhodobacteraceae bacterium]|nr:DUF2971 domain-containing protein [Paracoccaceae bacterium]
MTSQRKTAPKELKKYMKIERLKDALENKRIYLSGQEDQEKWEDGNDRELVNIYRKQKKLSDVRVTCFNAAADKYHFWDIFGGRDKGVCLRFNRRKLLANIKELDGNQKLRGKDVEYYNIKRFEKEGKFENLAFSKRSFYSDENEYRVICDVSAGGSLSPRYLRFCGDALEQVYFNSWISHSAYTELRAKYLVVLKNANMGHVTIHRSRVTSYAKWRDIAQKIAKFEK